MIAYEQNMVLNKYNHILTIRSVTDFWELDMATQEEGSVSSPHHHRSHCDRRDQLLHRKRFSDTSPKSLEEEYTLSLVG